jgi:hypothetical protein
MKEILEASQKENKSITLYVKGQSIGGSVMRIAADIVELRNRESAASYFASIRSMP